MCFFDFSKLKFQVWLNSVEFELRYCMKKNADTIGVREDVDVPDWGLGPRSCFY